jgi:hypothetical protein
MVSAAKAGALINAMDNAAAAAVDRIASFFDTGFLPEIFHVFRDGCAWRAEILAIYRADFQQADTASSPPYRGKIPAASQLINQLV